MARKKQKMFMWRVPVKAIYRGTALVEAPTAGEAAQRCKDGRFGLVHDGDVELSHYGAELVDWEVRGEPERLD